MIGVLGATPAQYPRKCASQKFGRNKTNSALWSTDGCVYRKLKKVTMSYIKSQSLDESKPRKRHYYLKEMLARLFSSIFTPLEVRQLFGMPCLGDSAEAKPTFLCASQWCRKKLNRTNTLDSIVKLMLISDADYNSDDAKPTF